MDKHTYFIRHTSQLDVDNETLQKLWDEDYIAIHFPHDREWRAGGPDSRSLDPKDYDGNGRSCLARLNALASQGGYVFAAYRNQAGAKIGYVFPGSKVDLIKGKWGKQNNSEGKEAILKGIKLANVTNLDASGSIALKAGQPRQGTFCRWRQVGPRVRNLVDGSDAISLECLTPDLQEVMCMEFLRSELASAHGLPRLALTLAPVGRTLKDIDIFGLTSDGQRLFAQVTMAQYGASQKKLTKLDPYQHGGHHTIYFCQADAIHRQNGHLIVPISKVFEEFCLKSEGGRRWFKSATGLDVVR